jgi:hypothetical protein
MMLKQFSANGASARSRACGVYCQAVKYRTLWQRAEIAIGSI